MSKDKVEIMPRFELATIEKSNAVEVFTGGGIVPILKAITEEVRAYKADTSTVAGRKAIASLAYKVSQSKTLLEEAGKSLVADWKAKSKSVDVVRKQTRDMLDLLRDEARAPLTEWEAVEEKRIKDEFLAEEKRLEEEKLAIQKLADEAEAHADNELRDRERAVAKREEAARVKEEDRLEAERVAREERDRLEREETIRKEAAEQAERKAAEAVQRAEQEKAYAEKAKLQAEEDAKQAKIDAEKLAEYERLKAEKDKEDAIQAERDRVKAKEDAERLETKKREADTKHKAAVNNAAVNALIETCCMESDHAKEVVKKIIRGQIPAVSIKY